jgi:hypothetical protein
MIMAKPCSAAVSSPRSRESRVRGAARSPRSRGSRVRGAARSPRSRGSRVRGAARSPRSCADWLPGRGWLSQIMPEIGRGLAAGAVAAECRVEPAELAAANNCAVPRGCGRSCGSLRATGRSRRARARPRKAAASRSRRPQGPPRPASASSVLTRRAGRSAPGRAAQPRTGRGRPRRCSAWRRTENGEPCKMPAGCAARCVRSVNPLRARTWPRCTEAARSIALATLGSSRGCLKGGPLVRPRRREP